MTENFYHKKIKKSKKMFLKREVSYKNNLEYNNFFLSHI